MDMHHLGEPCDICNGDGLDYIGRECRRWDKSGDPHYPPPSTPRTPGSVRFFGGPLNGKVLPVNHDRAVMLAPVPETVPYSLDDMDPIASAIRTVRYDMEKVGANVKPEPFVARVAVAEGYPRHRIIDEMNAVLRLCEWPWSLKVSP
jgi:hypothetical protein